MISTKGRYAVRALLDIAMSSDQGTEAISSAVIAQRQNISKMYLEQLFARLRTAGLVKSVRGPKGGFALARPPETISVKAIVEAMEGPFIIAECTVRDGMCLREDRCAARSVWKTVKTAVDDILSGISLKQLADSEIGGE